MNKVSGKVVALLPMKANSERIKGKNFKNFNGKPLFRWILDTLLQVEEIEKVVINTDARQILADNGLIDTSRILIRDRKSEICGDLVSMNRVIADDISSVSADTYLMTHTTNPLISISTIRAALSSFYRSRIEGSADSLFAANKVQTRFYRADCSAINHDPNNLIRTQYLEPWFAENSNLYLFTRESFAATNARIGKKPMLFECPRCESTDIDNQEDWDLAIIAARYLQEKNIS